MTNSMNDQECEARSKSKHIKCVIAVIPIFFALACGPAHEPVAASECSKVATHARKLLGSRADSHAETMVTCKAASDEERGCAMVADSAADLMRCSM
ncbi:MAG: hypothetical protein ACI8W3_000373 [Myxococcota bacterium]|jgi:hypothetical protein